MNQEQALKIGNCSAYDTIKICLLLVIPSLVFFA
jgi:hypothetical protein